MDQYDIIGDILIINNAYLCFLNIATQLRKGCAKCGQNCVSSQKILSISIVILVYGHLCEIGLKL